ncbi:MAG TPA: hypothetical protein VEM38_07675 [Burkholderiales bacterium]|nr:hypothetical protein [Burkholderiales bacterium]
MAGDAPTPPKAADELKQMLDELANQMPFPANVVVGNIMKRAQKAIDERDREFNDLKFRVSELERTVSDYNHRQG